MSLPLLNMHFQIQGSWNRGGQGGQGMQSPSQILANALTLFQSGVGRLWPPDPPPHCVLKWGFMQTFPGNQDAT